MSHTYSRLLYHIVFSTKGRQPWIDDNVRDDLHAYLGGIVRHLSGTALSIGGIADHVHILAHVPPKISLSDALRTIKANSSKWMHETRSLPRFQWQEGYSVFSVSESNRELVMRYIQNQADHHRRRSFQDELLELLRKHRIDFDPQHLWE